MLGGRQIQGIHGAYTEITKKTDFREKIFFQKFKY